MMRRGGEEARRRGADGRAPHASRLTPHASLKNGLTYLALILFGVIAAGPIVFLVATSLKETFTRSVDLSALWNPTFKNYHDVWFVHPFKKWMVNSLIVGAAVTALILFVDSLAGYAFARKKFRGREGLFLLLL